MTLIPHCQWGINFFVFGYINCTDMNIGGISLSATGYIQVRAYTAIAQIPLEDVAIAVTDSGGKLIALRLTDKNGKIIPIAVSTPDFADSQEPTTGPKPFTSVNLTAHIEDYEDIEIENLQSFADTVSIQQLAMIPLAELPTDWNKAEIFETTPQNL